MRDIQQPFAPQGLTQAIVVGSSASPPLQVSSGSIQGVRLRTSNNFPCVVALGTSSVAAEGGSTSAVFDSFILSTVEVIKLTVPPNCWISATTTGTTSTNMAVYITPGFGV